MDDQRTDRASGDSLSARDLIYIQILNFGLIALRNAAYRGEVSYWLIESDHLHNVPSLIGEPNEKRHDYYFDTERPNYLEHVERCETDTSFAIARYTELWKQLEQLRMKQ
jgi:hypothetical protein